MIINVFNFFFYYSGVVTMSADSTATSDASDPGSPFSHTSASTCTDDVSAAQKSTKIKLPNVSSQTTQQQQQGGKTLKRQAQVTDKCDKKRVKKELCSKNNNVEIKLIPLSTPTTTANNSNTQASVKKATTANKSILSPITNNNLKKTAIITPPPPIVIPTPPSSQQQPPNLTSITSTPIGASAISKLTDYFKLKKDPAKLNEYCNMLFNLQSGAKQNNNSKVGKIEKNIAATTITPVTLQHQAKINPIKPIASTKKLTNEKKTAKIAPIIPVARKNTTTQSSVSSVQQPVKISPKKPVSIAPRIVDTIKTTPTRNAILQPKPVSMTVANGKSATSNGKIIAPNNNPTTTTAQQNSSQQPTVLLAAIRIPNQMQPSSQPPPLKIQSGLIQKTTTTTTTTTKLAPLLQFHTQQMIPNLIQFQPNLIATDKTSIKSNIPTSSASQMQAPNLIVNNGQLTHQQQQQLFMNGAVIKLQPLPTTSQHQNCSQATAAVTSSAAMTSINGAAQKFAIQQQQQAFTAQLTAQHMQQLFMTTPVLFNTSSIPTVLTSQLAGLQHAFNQQQAAVSMAPPSTIPALQPIQSLLSSTFASSSLTSTTNSMHLPSFSTLLQNHPGMAAAAQQLQNIQLQQQQQNVPTLMKPFTTSLPPSLTITSGFVPNNQQLPAKVNVPPQATIAPTQKAPPPLAPASNHPINLPKLISVTSSASQTSPKSSPPPLVINQKVSLPQGSPAVSKPTNTTTAIKQENNIEGTPQKQNAICVVPPLPSPAKPALKLEVEAEEKITLTETAKDTSKSAISIIVEEKSTIECAKSPILSQPKTIRFPPVNGKVTVWKKCIKISKTGVCNWEKCCKHFDSNADLLEHLNDDHINELEDVFSCQWRGCKVNGCKGSKGWLERHVMSHVGSKPFKCIVERCGLRFSTQVSKNIYFLI